MASGTDLVAKLMLDNNDFTKGLMDSKNQLDAFKKVGSGVTTMLGKFAGAAGVALGGMELFTTAINSNSELGLKWNTTVDAMKLSVNNFFTALTTGDWSKFEDGITNAINKAKEYSLQMNLLRQHLDLGLEKADAQKIIKEQYESEIESPFTTVSEKNTAFENYKKQWEKEQRERKSSMKLIEDSLLKGAKSQGITFIKSAQEFREVFYELLDPKTFAYRESERYNKARDKARASLNEATKKKNSAKSDTFSYWVEEETRRKQAYDALYDDYFEQLRSFRNFYGQNADGNNKEYGTTKQALEDWKDHLDNLNTGKKDYDGAKDSLKKAIEEANQKSSSYRGSTGGNDKDYEQFSIGYYQQLIDNFEKIKKSAKLSSDEIKDFNDQIDTAKDIIKYLDTGEGSGEYFYLWDILGKGSREEYGRLQDQNFKYPDKPDLVPEELFSESEKKWNDQMYNFLDKNGLYDKNGHIDNKKFLEFFKGSSNKLPTVQVEFKNGSLNKLREDRQKLVDQLNAAQTDEERVEIQAKIVANQKQEQNIMNKLDGKKMFSDKIAKANEYSQAIQNISASIMALNATKFENNAQGWTQWTTSVLSQAASVIAAYYSMAMAAGTANAFKMPFPANLAVWGSITAAIISTFASLPKFADGGIFAGNSTSGDMNLARVNAGEMILNNRQQRNLFNLLNNGGSTSGSSGGAVEFKIRGKELVGVLNNYGKQINRV